MSNKLTVSVEFSFKGQHFNPSSELDLDTFMQTNGHLPDFHTLLANANGIGFYSYEFEMMQAEPILFSQPQGLVAEYVHDDSLDRDGFEAAWHKQKLDKILQDIAQQYMSVEQLEQNPKLKSALLAAYQLGKTSND